MSDLPLSPSWQTVTTRTMPSGTALEWRVWLPGRPGLATFVSCSRTGLTPPTVKLPAIADMARDLSTNSRRFITCFSLFPERVGGSLLEFAADVAGVAVREIRALHHQD